MIKILVTGANGQLGNELRVVQSEFTGLDIVFTDVAELNITDRNEVEQFLAADSFDFCINCAAYTAVDKAEEEADKAYLLNEQAVALLAELTAKANVKMVHISTDFVFDGKKSTPYLEEDHTGPANVYASSKLKGEETCLSHNKESIIIRTSWLYSSFGNNFVKTMRKLGKERDSLGVVYDQVGTPTYANDLARVILKVISQFDNNPQYGIYHYSNEGVCSWYDFAVAIMEISGLSCAVSPILTEEYPTPATRAPYTVMNKAKIKKTFGIEIPHWQDGLNRCIKILAQHD